MATLTRVSLDSLVATDSRALLIAKAAALIKGKPLNDSTPLRDALLHLAIEPINAATVTAYKNDKRRNIARWSNGTIAGFACSLLSIAVPAMLFRMGHHAASDAWQEVVGYIGGALTTGGVLAAWYNWFDEKVTRNIVTDWTRHPLVLELDYYNKAQAFALADMPDFAIDRFIAVREACPKASFFVDALHTSDTHSKSRAELRREADPFLVACLGDEEFYLDVWEEPQFERTI